MYVPTYVCAYLHMFECAHAEFKKSAAKGEASVVKLSVGVLTSAIHTSIILYINVHTYIVRMCVLIRLSETQKGDRVLENRALFEKKPAVFHLE